MNQKREAAGLAPVSVDSLELLMDRLEKESYFQVSNFTAQFIIVFFFVYLHVITPFKIAVEKYNMVTVLKQKKQMKRQN